MEKQEHPKLNWSIITFRITLRKKSPTLLNDYRYTDPELQMMYDLNDEQLQEKYEHDPTFREYVDSNI